MANLAGLDVTGISVGGIETCLEVPEYKLAFDLGRCAESVIARSTVLFTHAHADHMGSVVHHAATRALRRMEPPTYVLPPVYADAFADLFDAWRRLDGSELPYEAVVIGPGEEHVVCRGLVAQAFHSPHRAPCQGYILWREVQKLLAEYEGLEGPQIARLRNEGVSVTSTTRVPELAFTGDTTIDSIEREEGLRRARRLIMEVTFLDDRVPAAQAHAMGHVHLDEVVERAELFENEALLFTHFSARYSPEEIVAALDEKLPAGLRERVTPLLEGRR